MSSSASEFALQHAVTLPLPAVVVFATAFGFALAGTLLALTEILARQRLTLLPSKPLENWLGLGGIIVRIISGPVIVLTQVHAMMRHSKSRASLLIGASAFSAFWAFCSGVVALHGLSALLT